MPPVAFSRLPLTAQANLVLLGLIVAAVSALLWPHWRGNPDLSHGYFMPLLFLLLLHESRQRGTARWLPPGLWRGTLMTTLLLGGLVFLVGAGLYATSVGWGHAIVAFTLTTALVLLLGAGLVSLAAAEVRAVPCNWIAFVAIGLWLLCAPIPPGTYSRISLSLQLWISEYVLASLHLLGIAASRTGNIIELANVSVGVEEACSGVRSLISCIFAGLFFSASMVRRPWARGLIILLAPPLALGMNFLRSLLLTLLANRNVDISGAWHDATGFAVLGITAVILGGIALLLENPALRPVAVPAEKSDPTPSLPLQLGLSGTLLAALGLATFFYINTRPVLDTDTPVPDLLAILPARAEGWSVKTSNDLFQFRDTLQTDHLAQRTYLKQTANGFTQVTVYLAYWRPGQTAVSQVASHTPDACWPGAGWELTTIDEPRVLLTVDERRVAPAEMRFFRSGDFPQYVWFWHLFDGRPIAYSDPYSWSELLRIAWRYGFRHDGDQLFVRISSNRPWEELATDPLMSGIFSRLQPLGL
ncbi:MAG TPA: exosortase/archaeosortase family protein [Opitutaceae bacterium]|nr:exosortase/archaeosortase family protein [Opitutaceae bacterium]HRJ45831.1 exosortase/archaeosortase family protein [Opitutaceae bacterium]